jgi:predicted porin
LPQFRGFSGDFVCLGCEAINNTSINNTAYSAHDKIHQVFWAGAKYAVTDKLDVIGGYHHYLQNSFGAVECSTAASSTCSGTMDAVPFAVDWKCAAKFDAYAGLMYSQVNNGLANGYLNRDNIDPQSASASNSKAGEQGSREWNVAAHSPPPRRSRNG